MILVIFMYLKTAWDITGNYCEIECSEIEAEETAKPFCPAVSVKLCAETLPALWGIKGMTRLRYLIHVAGLSTAKEDNSVFSLHQVQSLPLAVLMQHRAFWSNYVTVWHFGSHRGLDIGLCLTTCRGMVAQNDFINIVNFGFDFICLVTCMFLWNSLCTANRILQSFCGTSSIKVWQAAESATASVIGIEKLVSDFL